MNWREGRLIAAAARRSRGLAAGAKAGHRHGQIGAGGGEIHALADNRGLRTLATPPKAVQQPR
jgi:hypothetical protein